MAALTKSVVIFQFSAKPALPNAAGSQYALLTAGAGDDRINLVAVIHHYESSCYGRPAIGEDDGERASAVRIHVFTAFLKRMGLPAGEAQAIRASN